MLGREEMNQAMNETNINTELLSAESRGRKHIPLAVFAVIIIHVALFLVLLIAAGCRAKARAKQNPDGMAVAAAAQPEGSAAVHPALMPAGVETADQAAGTDPLISQAEGLVIASEPVEVRERASAPGPQRAPQRALASRPRAESAGAPRVARKVSEAGETAGGTRVYVVQPGDTVGKIAKEQGVSIQSIRTQNKLKKDLIYPGQKLRLGPKQTPRQMAAL